MEMNWRADKRALFIGVLGANQHTDPLDATHPGVDSEIRGFRRVTSCTHHDRNSTHPVTANWDDSDTHNNE